MFKISRLTFVALFCVHLFACMFFWVKTESASSPADVVEFYAARNIAEDVSTGLEPGEMYFNIVHLCAFSSKQAALE